MTKDEVGVIRSRGARRNNSYYYRLWRWFKRQLPTHLRRRVKDFVWRSRKYIDQKCGPSLGKLYLHDPILLKIPPRYSESISIANPPLITIVTPSYNQGHFVAQTIDSVLDQHYPNLEYIVQDGGSSDNSTEVIAPYSNRLTRWESKPDKGQADAVNLGFADTHGEIMAYLNSDDLLLPGALNYVAAYFATHPNVDVVYGHRVIIDPNGEEVGRWVLPPHKNKVIKWVDFIPQETLFWRRRIWDKVGGMVNADFRFALDWDLIMRFQEAGAKIVRLPRFLGAFRVHPEQKTNMQIHSRGFDEMQYIREKYIGYAPYSWEIKKNVALYMIQHVAYDWLYKMRILHY